MTIRDIAIAFGFEVDKASKEKAEGSIKGLKVLATSMLGVLGVRFSIQGLSSMAQAAADVEAMNSQFQQVFGEIEEVASEKLDAIASDTGVLVNRMKSSYTNIAAFAKTTGLSQAESLEIAERSMIAVADSAAFYDRSIEDVTETLRSFLKGNYANDASLGLSATETTRNTAANELYGKSFKDLSEAQKQMTLLKMVEDANKLSGALGQAGRESDTWSNQLGNLRQNIKDLQANTGKIFLRPAIFVLKFMSSLVKKVSDGVEGLTKENGFLTKSAHRMESIYQRVKPLFEKTAQILSTEFSKGGKKISDIVEKLGGMENVLKIIAIAAAVIPILLNWGKIIAGAKTMLGMMSTLKSVFGAVNWQIMAVVAVIVILALIVEDFIAFLSGKDSVIGSLFEKFGINAEEVKEKIMNAWNTVSGFLVGIWDGIVQGVGMLVDMIDGFINMHGDEIIAIFKKAWGIVQTFIEGVMIFIGSLFSTIFGDAQSGVSESNESMKEKIMSVWQAILEFLSNLLNAIFNLFSAVFNVVADIINFVFSGIKAFWSAWGDEILSLFRTVFEAIVNIFNSALDIINSVAEFFSAIFTGNWSAAWQAVQDIFSSVMNIIADIATATMSALGLVFSMALSAISALFTSIFTGIATSVTSILTGLSSGISSVISEISNEIVNGFNTAIEFITGLPSKAVTWGKDFINGLADGIMSGVNKVVDSVKSVGNKIKEYLHFSVPDKGPLTDYETWMPDFMSGLAKGIGENEGLVLKKIKGLASGMKMLMESGTASIATASNSRIGSSSTNMTQNVNINNSYSGGTQEAQKAVSGTMKKSAQDATTYMARGLSYARG